MSSSSLFSSSRLLPICFLAYASGILVAPYGRPIEAGLWLTFLCFGFIALFLFKNLRGYILILFLSFFGYAYYHMTLTAPKHPDHIIHLAGKNTIIEGFVTSISPRPKGASLEMEAQAKVDAKGFSSLGGKVLLYIRNGLPVVEPGDRIRVFAKLRKPQLKGVPGEFHFPRYLARNNIFITGTVNSANWVIKIVGKNRGNLRDRIESFRNDVRVFIDMKTKPATTPFLKALAIADRSGFTLEDKNLLGRSGVSHLFAISGLHLGLLFCFFYGILKSFYKRSRTLLLLSPPRRILPLLILPLLLMYLLLAGSGIPTQRAFLAILLGSVLLLLDYHFSPIRMVLALAFVLILEDPLAFFDPSYQLSFAAVFAILLFAPKWQDYLHNRPKFIRYIGNLFFVTITATLATLPFVLLHFHVFPFSGLLLNMICVPLVAFLALPFALAGVASFSIWPFLGDLFFQGSAMILDLVLVLIKALTPSSASGLAAIYLSPIEIGVLFLLTVIILTRKKLPLNPMLWWGTVGLFVILFFFSPIPAHKAFTLTAINVGHGDALLITKGNKTYIVDGGGSYSDDYDVGARLLAPALGAMGIKNIDAVVLSHAHPDHFKGLNYILSHFRVKEFWSAIPEDQLPVKILEPLTLNHIPRRQFPEGWTLVHQSPEDVISVFVPPQKTSVVNDRSLVIYMRERKNSLLLTGDLEKDGVTKLLQDPLYAEATLLKLPHHGSPHSAPNRLIDIYSPELAFATTSRLLPNVKSKGHDRDSLPVYTYTIRKENLAGSMRFVAGPQGWQVRYWLRGLFR